MVAPCQKILDLKMEPLFLQLFVPFLVEFVHFAGAALAFAFSVFVGFIKNTQGHHFFVEIAAVYIAVK